MKTDPGRQFEQGDIPPEKSQLAVRSLRVGRKRPARAREVSREAVGELTPDDMYHGRQREILSCKEKIKHLTLERRKEDNLHDATWPRMEATTL